MATRRSQDGSSGFCRCVSEDFSSDTADFWAYYHIVDPHSASQAVTSAAQAVTEAAQAMANATQTEKSVWSVPNFLLLAQNVILAITGGLIYWYTRETQKLRVLSAEQRDFLRIQTEIARERSVVDRHTSEYEAARTQNESRPSFEWRGWARNGSSSNSTAWNGEFVNNGGAIHDVSVMTDAPLDSIVAPRGMIPGGRRGTVQMLARGRGVLAASWEFKIRFRTNINVEEEQAFRVDADGVGFIA